MSVNLNLLKEEIVNDPENLGYSSCLAIRDDIGLANIINLTRDTPAFNVPKGRISKDQFLEDTADIVFNLMLLESQGSNNAGFWLKVFDRLVANSDTINSEDPTLINLLDQMVSDNLLNNTQKNLILNRQGSRSEVLFNCNVTIDQISNSLNEVNE